MSSVIAASLVVVLMLLTMFVERSIDVPARAARDATLDQVAALPADESAQLGPVNLPQAYRLAASWDPERPTTGGRFYHPEGISIAPDGVIAVAERGNHLVSRWYASGEALGRWGTHGQGPGEFDAPEDVAWDHSGDVPRLYVADTGNNRLQVLDGRTGAFVDEWLGMGHPRSVAVAADGRVYVVDGDVAMVRVFDAAGLPVATIGGPGAGDGRLTDPIGVSVGPDGYVYVADHGAQRVVWYDADGTLVGELALDNTFMQGGAPFDVGVAESGDLFVAVDRGVLRFRARSTYAETLTPFWEKPRAGCPPGRCCIDLVPIEENHEGVRRLDVTDDGGVYFTYAPELRWKDRVTAIPSGWFANHWPQCGVPEARHATDPKRIDAGRDPYVQVLGTSKNLHVYQSDGRFYNAMLGNPAATGVDVAAGGIAGPMAGYRDPSRSYTAVVTGNQVQFHGVHKDGCAQCSYPRTCPPQPPVDVIDPDKVLEHLETVVHWNRALTFTECGYATVALDAAVPQIVVRPYLPSLATFATPMANGVRIGDRRLPFRGYSDLEYGPGETLYVLSRDGIVLSFDRFGRPGATIELRDLEGRSAEALAVASSNELFVITADEWVHKFDGSGTNLAAWSIPEAAGPGRYQDIAVDVYDRIVVPDGDNDRVVVFERYDGPAEEPPSRPSPRCRVTPSKSASPQRLPLGNTTDVNLQLAADCSVPHDIVVAVDGSCQMTGDRLVGAREGAARLVDSLVTGVDRMALISFTDEHGGARVLAPLTDDKAVLRQVAARLPTECLPAWLAPGRGEEGRVSDGVRAGREALFGPQGRPDAEKIFVLVTASVFDVDTIAERLRGTLGTQVTDREHVLWETRQLWQTGARVVTIGVGQDGIAQRHEPDQGLLAAMAMPPTDYYYAPPAGVPDVFGRLGSALTTELLFEHVALTDRVPGNMQLVAGSSRPPAQVDPDGTLRWTLTDIAASDRVELSYTLQPLDPGRWPTNIEAFAVYTDGLGWRGRTDFPVPVVDVIAPTPTVTFTPAASPTPRPTRTQTQIPTPTSTATPLPTPTATPSPEPLYLPILYKLRCKPTLVPIDVVLAIDTSSSMTADKISAAGAAARGFVALLNLPRDQAGVVTFDAEARLVQALTPDRDALTRALSHLPTNVGTRIDLALWVSLDAVAGSNGRTQADPVIVLLTDGRSQGGTETEIELALNIARDLRVTIFTIGLGADVDPSALLHISGDPEHVFLAPAAQDLPAIYDEIAQIIPCR